MVPSKCQFIEARGTYGTYVSLVMLFISYVSGPKNHHFASPVSQLYVNLLFYICNKSHATDQLLPMLAERPQRSRTLLRQPSATTPDCSSNGP